ncbi:LysM domain-containing protein [Cordyceps fumosorosea ARSEF 2679]|uniref:LysM domain-containing protein n=1 Tax=Cordyceps fumosorosea (strain ARSEF 2679) TaxID=1081104 RepID=A0A167ZL60_CORFA|nr:LysM domain-containing protein [Cordyceps fumosorosea ARSEF 2679]OAA67645.1 LysM domain-containing protein [Cordyceps fumosorosea ARSEF 2679]
MFWLQFLCFSAALLLLSTAQQFSQFTYAYEALGLSETCFAAVNATVQGCSDLLPTHVSFDSNPRLLGKAELEELCVPSCGKALADVKSSINEACATDSIVKNGQTFPATLMVEYMLYSYTMSCRKDSSSGQFCDVLYQKHRDQPSQDLVCSDCQLGAWKDELESPIGYDAQYAEEFIALTASCKANGYAFKTPSYSIHQPVPTSSPPAWSCETPYVVGGDDSCSILAQKLNVTEYGISDLNGLSLDCDPLPVGKTICLPPMCKIHKVKVADEINELAARYEVTVGQLVAWNPMIRLDGSNLYDLFGRSICISSPGGGANVDEGRPQKAVSVPENAHGESNKNCGKWYTVKKGDSCAKISLANSISLDDFYFLNPGVDKQCYNLWLDYAYCAQAVGDITAYPGYPVRVPSTTFTRPEPTPTSPPEEKPLAPGTIKNCFKYAPGYDIWYFDHDEINACDTFGRIYDVTVDALREWNPSLSANTCLFSKDHQYCVQKEEVERTVPEEPKQWCVKLPAGAMIEPGTAEDCNCFSFIRSWEVEYNVTCEGTAAAVELDVATFRSINPWLSEASCSADLVAGLDAEKDKKFFCAGAPSLHPRPTAAATAASSSDTTSSSTSMSSTPSSVVAKPTFTGGTGATPSPTQSGMANTCDRFHYVPKGGQSCESIASENGISVVDLGNWNAIAGNDCTQLSVNSYACVGAKNSYGFQQDMAGWTLYGDAYSVSDGNLVARSSNGDKAILSTPWTNFDASMDVKLDGETGDAGFIFRGSNMGTGADAYDGYYAGISAAGWLILGRVVNGVWSQLGWSNTDVPRNAWQKLRVRANRDKIEIYLGNGRTPLITAQDNTFSSGLLGTRVYWTGASFKGLSILPSRLEDFQSMPDDWSTYGRPFNMEPNGMVVVAEGEARATNPTKYASVKVEANLSIMNKGAGESGILFRASNVSESSYRGYYAYLSLDNGVVLGRQDESGWKQLRNAKVELRRETVYNLRVVASGSWIAVYLDGEMKFSADDASFMRGVAGLQSSSARTQFQNMYITGQPSYRVMDDFSDGTMSGWQVYSGEFDASSQALVAKSASDGKAALDSFFSNVAMSMDIAFPDGGGGGDAGFIFRVAELGPGGDDLRGYYAGLSRDGSVIVARMDRGWTELKRGKTWEVQGPTKMTVSAEGDKIRVVVNRQVVVDTTDSMFAGGLVGVRTYQADVSFDNLWVRDL